MARRYTVLLNITNIKQIVPKLFPENLIRGRGLFARCIMKAQDASSLFTPVFAALVAIIYNVQDSLSKFEISFFSPSLVGL
jgi:hypothetical protein